MIDETTVAHFNVLADDARAASNPDTARKLLIAILKNAIIRTNATSKDTFLKMEIVDLIKEVYEGASLDSFERTYLLEMLRGAERIMKGMKTHEDSRLRSLWYEAITHASDILKSDKLFQVLLHTNYAVRIAKAMEETT